MITKKLKILLGLELKRILKNSRSSTKRISSMVMMVLVGLAMVFYSGLFTMILVTSNNSKDLALAFGLVLTLLTFFTGISNGNKNLFSRDEFEILYPMPLGEGDILMAKFIGIYLDRKSRELLGVEAIGFTGVKNRIDVYASFMTFHGKIQDLEFLDLAYAPPFSTVRDVVLYTGMIGTNLLDKDAPSESHQVNQDFMNYIKNLPRP